MDDAIKRSVERQFPELTGGYHLPRFAKVVAVADAPASAGLCDDFRPRFSVDLQVMGPDGEIDTTLPVLAGVPLPLFFHLSTRIKNLIMDTFFLTTVSILKLMIGGVVLKIF
ncbi:hypothetical protein AAY86_26070 [Pseudomonas amygdali pv. tabaci str. ATCC 11528]|uniref:Uncharacterized protein n=1 Tax=Pseudomonas amygdali pv. lachrymans str. M301315 TaxID=629260 RepID=A0AAD0M415_PSEAV|nr:hypothetical protein B5U27_27400 [Pseudomonas amygdali pv. lachrymans]AXH58636.1 hypothetical protein PLA107_027940 [Pseudomonas amygdali pv. lachrymans str. M301315]KEZ68624.1 hypothetical protein C1E_0210635 [Pseudomonas amygdali pv. tabaci str. ATCC 11528]KKY49781.1 hypothetical protein AAY86_26070 [Pseudomonas amygdali pv. tabaci str. ATCC 11528]KKY57800.1 hypothetical protein AAY85_11500 [Pseudomonas amygdali pv. lachrymans]